MNVKGFWKPDAVTLAALYRGAAAVKKARRTHAIARNVSRSKGRV